MWPGCQAKPQTPGRLLQQGLPLGNGRHYTMKAEGCLSNRRTWQLQIGLPGGLCAPSRTVCFTSWDNPTGYSQKKLEVDPGSTSQSSATQSCRCSGIPASGRLPTPCLRSRREAGYLAKSTARVSRMTVTLICPGYCRFSSTALATFLESWMAARSSTCSGLTMIRISRPA